MNKYINFAYNAMSYSCNNPKVTNRVELISIILVIGGPSMDSLYRGKKIKLSELDIDPIKVLEREYGLEAEKIEDVKAVGKVKLKDRNICFKKSKDNEEKVWFIYSAINHLITNGFNKTVPFILTKKGLPFIKVNDHLFYVTEWIEGEKCNFAIPEHLKAGTITLAQLHQYSRGFKPVPQSKPKILIGKWPNILQQRNYDFNKFIKIIKTKSKISEFDYLYLKNFKYYKDLADKACEIMSMDDYYKVLIDQVKVENTFTHRDVADRNFIIVPNGDAHIIDFDYCRLDIRINDLLRIIERTLKDLKWDFNICRYIIDSYQLVNQIMPQEYIILFSFLMFPQKLWRTADRYYNVKDDWTDDELLKKLVEFINRKEQERAFLKEFYQVYCKDLIKNPFD